MPKGGNKNNPVWTDEEDARLRELYAELHDGKITRVEISTLLSRSKAAIACRAGSIGISFPRGKSVLADSTRLKIKATKLANPPSKAWLAGAAERQRQYIAKCGHPKGMLGKKHSPQFSEAQSIRCTGLKQTWDHVTKRLKSKLASQGTLAPKHGRGSWKAGWRQIGEQRIYARSKWEANYARYLQWLLERGEITQWQHEPETFWFEKIKRGCRSYLPDFRVSFIDAHVEYHEVKGWMDPRSATKIKRMAKYHPGIVLRVFDSSWFKANARTFSKILPGWE